MKIVLIGEGADEILAGHPSYRYEQQAALYQKFVPSFVHEIIIEPLLDALPVRFHRPQTLIHFFGLRDAHERLPRWFDMLDSAERAALIAVDLSPHRVSDFAFAADDDVSPMRRSLFFDQARGCPIICWNAATI